MLTNEQLKNILHGDQISRKDKILVILAVDDGKPKRTSEIRDIAVASGLREAKKWNVSDILGHAKGLAIPLKEGWVLNDKGRDYIKQSGIVPASRKASKKIVTDLRHHLASITDTKTVKFLDEAITCYESELYRAAVVLSWVGAVSVLYNHVLKHELSNFNVEAKRRDSKWKDAKTTDDLAKLGEHEFLNILEAISVIGKNVKQELQNLCLKLRNACGHPSSLAISQNRVSAHLEILILNVFSKF